MGEYELVERCAYCNEPFTNAKRHEVVPLDSYGNSIPIGGIGHVTRATFVKVSICSPCYFQPRQPPRSFYV